MQSILHARLFIGCPAGPFRGKSSQAAPLVKGSPLFHARALPQALRAQPVHNKSRRSALLFIGSSLAFGLNPWKPRGAIAKETRLRAQSADVGASPISDTPAWTPPPTRVTAPGRIVAIGDLHGDLAQSMRALQLAGVIGLDGNRAIWTGGNTTLVQMGDILDRGSEEIGILFLLQRLAEGAEAAGGAVYVLNGNHEMLNISGDFRYVTAGAFQESARFGRRLEELFGEPSEMGPEDLADPDAAWELALRTRVGLFAPGGPLAQQFARNSTVLIINDTVFAHGGLLPSHVKFGLERINEGVSRWMLGESNQAIEEVLQVAAGRANSVVWNRQFGKEAYKGQDERERNCRALQQALQMAGVKRMVVGHTPQLGGCNAECDGKVWRIDVGLSRGVLGSSPQVLEIDGDNVRVLGTWVPPDLSGDSTSSGGGGAGGSGGAASSEDESADEGSARQARAENADAASSI